MLLLSFRPRAATTLLSSCHRCLFSNPRFATTAAAVQASASPAPFAVQDYLVSSCHLTPAQAFKASKSISHLKSPSKPEAVLAVLSDLGLSRTDVAAVVVHHPRLLCSKVHETLVPRLAELRDFGLSPSQIARLVLVDPVGVCRTTIISKLQYHVPFFGSFETLFQAIKKNSYLLGCNLENVVKPNVALLQACGLGACDIAKMCVQQPSLLTIRLERLRAMVGRAESLGVPRGSGMFSYALMAVAFVGEDKVVAKVEFLKKTFRWSEAEVAIAVAKLPVVLRNSRDKLMRTAEFLLSEVGLEPEYIARRPTMISLSLETRLGPRYYVVKFLKEHGLLNRDRSYFTAVQLTEKVFLDKFIHPHKNAAPHLAEDYAAALRGEVPTRLRLQEPTTGSKRKAEVLSLVVESTSEEKVF